VHRQGGQIVAGSIEQLQALLKAELQRRGVDYRQLARRLTEMGLEETPDSIAAKLDRGVPDKAFLLQCFEAAGAPTVHLDF
jgi:hypothetical protein